MSVLFLIILFNVKAQIITEDILMEILSSPVNGGVVAVDQDGNTYGSQQALVMFEDGTSYGTGGEKVVYKHDTNGNLIWAYNTTGSCFDLAIGTGGHIYLSGYSSYPSGIDTTVVNLANKFFLANIDTNGIFKTAIPFPAPPSFRIKNNGNVIFVFEWEDDGFLGSEFISNLGGPHIIYGEIDVNGTVLWRTIVPFQFFTPGALELVEGCAIYGDELYFYGAFHGNGVFDTISLNLYNVDGVGIYSTRKVYLARANLITQQITQVISTVDLAFKDIEVDDYGRIYLATQHWNDYGATDGSFQGLTIPLPVRQDAYVLKLNNDFSFVDWYNIGLDANINNSHVYIKDIVVQDENCFALGYHSGQGADLYLYPGGPNIGATPNFYLIGLNDSLNYRSDYIIPATSGNPGPSNKMDLAANDESIVTYLETASPIDTTSFNDTYFIGHYKTNTNVISGRAFKDFNMNSIYDAGDIPLSGSVVSSIPSAYNTIVLPDGQFLMHVDSGEYVLEIPVTPNYYTNEPLNDTIYFPGNNLEDSTNLTLIPVPGANDVRVDLIPISPVVVMDTAIHKILITNDGTSTEDGTVTVYPLQYTTAYTGPFTTPAMVDQGGYYTYDFTGLLPGDTFSITIKYAIPLSFLANIGDSSNTVVMVDIINNDTNLLNNTATFNEVVLSSYDPNIKQSNKPLFIDVDSLSSFDYISYTIHFQNEGNYPATNIRVDDVISDKLDLQSFQLIDYSDDVWAEIVGRKIKFHFDSIMLPPSSTDPDGSIGYIHYRIKKNNNLIAGDTISNQAFIFFDYNPPIITNNELNIIYDCEQFGAINGSSSVCIGDSTLLYSDNMMIETFEWFHNGNLVSTTNYYEFSPAGLSDTIQVIFSNPVCTLDSIIELSILYPSSTYDTVISCNSYFWPQNNVSYTISGDYNVVELGTNGCDSLINLNLTIASADTLLDIVSACGSYIWSVNGATYDSSGIYTEIFTNMYGCDSIEILNITLNDISSYTETITACDSYTWSSNGLTYTSSGIYSDTLLNVFGCDSINTLNLNITNSNIGSDVITACESYTWIDGNTYTTSTNMPTWTLTNLQGCDSVITLNLVVNTPPDSSVIQTGSTLTAIQSGAIYQWLDCDNNYTIINGETNQVYTPIPTTGNYALEVSLNGCTDTSSCFLVDYSGLIQQFNTTVILHPNPASEVITIEGIDQLPGFKGMEITSSCGRLIHATDQTVNILDISNLSNGYYFLNLFHEQGTMTLRFVKQ